MGLRKIKAEVKEYFLEDKVISISKYLYAKSDFGVNLTLDTQIIHKTKRDIRKEMIKGYMSLLSVN